MADHTDRWARYFGLEQADKVRKTESIEPALTSNNILKLERTKKNLDKDIEAFKHHEGIYNTQAKFYMTRRDDALPGYGPVPPKYNYMPYKESTIRDRELVQQQIHRLNEEKKRQEANVKMIAELLTQAQQRTLTEKGKSKDIKSLHFDSTAQTVLNILPGPIIKKVATEPITKLKDEVEVMTKRVEDGFMLDEAEQAKLEEKQHKLEYASKKEMQALIIQDYYSIGKLEEAVDNALDTVKNKKTTYEQILARLSSMDLVSDEDIESVKHGVPGATNDKKKNYN